MQQLSVFVQNHPGALADVTQALAEKSINIRAFSLYDTPDFNILRLITDKPEETRALLQEKGFFCKETQVLGIALRDRPGELNAILQLLKGGGIQIAYIYSLALPTGTADEDSCPAIPLLILSSEQQEAARELLKDYTIY